MILSLLEQNSSEDTDKEIYRLIDRYHEYLDPERVLKLFPDDTSLAKLYPYASQAITALTEEMYNMRMKYNLMMSDYLEVCAGGMNKLQNKHAVAVSRQNGVEVDEDSICAKCGKPLGTAAIVWINNTELYHYSCCEMEGYVVLRSDQVGTIYC